jgi:hypothetical protein
MFQDVVRDPDREADDIAAGSVARSPPARRIGYLTGVARPDEVV